MGTLLQDIRYAIRMLAKNPASRSSRCSLAAGSRTGANTAIFTVVNGVLLSAAAVSAARPGSIALYEDGELRSSPSDLVTRAFRIGSNRIAPSSRYPRLPTARMITASQRWARQSGCPSGKCPHGILRRCSVTIRFTGRLFSTGRKRAALGASQVALTGRRILAAQFRLFA